MCSIVSSSCPCCCHTHRHNLCAVQAHETSGADVSSTAAAESSSSNSGNTNVEAMVAALRQLQCEELAVPEACADITNTARGSGASSSDTSSPEPDVGPLVELSPAGVSQQFLQHCLQQQFHNDMQVKPQH